MQLLRQETATIYKMQDYIIAWNTFYLHDNAMNEKDLLQY
jgi:hypothetical protein